MSKDHEEVAYDSGLGSTNLRRGLQMGHGSPQIGEDVAGGQCGNSWRSGMCQFVVGL